MTPPAEPLAPAPVSERAGPFAGIHRNVFALGLTSLFTDVSSEMLVPVLPLFITGTLHASVASLGIIEGVAECTASALRVGSGWLSDRIGRRKPLIWPSGLMLPPLWFLMLAPLPPWALVVVALAVGCFVFLPFPSLMTIPLEIVGLSPAERAVGQALQASISTAGVLLGPIIASHIVDRTGSYRSGLLPLLLLPTLFLWISPFLPETGTRARATAQAHGD